MSTQLPQIKNSQTQKIQYSYKSLNASMNLKRTTPVGKAQSINRNIDRYQKTSDVHDILGHEKNTYPQLLGDSSVDQNTEVSGSLKVLRKQYDNLRNKSLKREKEIIKMRNEIDQIQVQQDGMSGSKEYYTRKIEDLQKQQDEIGNQLSEAKMNKKIYYHMITRMKKDLIFFKLKAQETEVELNKGKTVLQSAKENYQKSKQKYNKIEMALEEVEIKKEEDTLDRKKNIDSFIEQVVQKQDQEKQREARIKRQIEIAEIAANDIRDSNLKKWRKLLLVHSFLNTFLKRKMEREMSKYIGVEEAFQKIKAATGISEAGEIVHKFLNREHTYSHLLISIADYEQKIDQLKKQNETFKNRLQKLKQDIVPVEKLESKSNNKQNLKNEEIGQELQRVGDKFDQCQLTEERVYEWLVRNLMRIERALGQESEDKTCRQTYSKNDIPAIFEKLTNNLQEGLLTLDPQEVDEAITQFIKNNKQQQSQFLNKSENSQMNSSQNNRNIIQEEDAIAEFQKRNVRARPPSHRIDTSTDSFRDLNDFNDDGGQTRDGDDDFEKEEKDEIDYLREQRNVLRQNEHYRKSLAINNSTFKK